MRRSGTFLSAVVLSLWMGGGFFLAAIAAPSAFQFAPSPTAAADIVGAMISKWHYLSIGAPLLLLITELRRKAGARTSATILLAVALLLASGASALDLGIRKLRRDSFAPISSLSRTDPLRRRFGIMHGVSSLSLLLQIASAIGYAALRDDPEGETSSALL